MAPATVVAPVAAPVAARPPNVYQHMTALAASLGAVNLGQGFPDEGTPDVLVEAARQALGRVDQYTDSAGLPALRAAIASGCAPAADPDAEVTVTAGCTEALAATLLAVLEPGDEALAFETTGNPGRPAVQIDEPEEESSDGHLPIVEAA